MVLCKDSNKSEWIYVIKSGSCRVLTALHAVRPSIQCNDRWDHTKDVVPGPSVRPSVCLAGWPVCLSVCLSVCLHAVRPSIQSTTCWGHTKDVVQGSACLSVCLSICPSVCLSVCTP